MKSAVAIRHVAFEDLDAFAPALARAGYEVSYQDVGEAVGGALDPLEADLLVVLGGPIGAYEEAAYPFLSDEIGLIEKRLAAGRPLMGICLGAQLIARAAGARVYPAGVREIGFAPIALTAAGEASCLAPFKQDPIVLHWHGDTFDLPRGAERLASTDLCENQAFSMGRHAIGFQFHPEVSGARLESWLVGHAVELSGAGIDVPGLRAAARGHAAAFETRAQLVAVAWLDQLDS